MFCVETLEDCRKKEIIFLECFNIETPICVLDERTIIYEGCCGEITQKVLNGRNVVSAFLESDFIEIMTIISDIEIEDSELTEDKL